MLRWDVCNAYFFTFTVQFWYILYYLKAFLKLFTNNCQIVDFPENWKNDIDQQKLKILGWDLFLSDFPRIKSIDSLYQKLNLTTC